MKQTLRYQLTGVHEVTSIKMPKDSLVFDAVYSEKRQAFSIYTVGDTENTEFVDRQFTVVPTGADVPGMLPIRSIVMPDGFHVFHVMEII